MHVRIYLYMHKWSLEGSTWNRVGVQGLIKLGLPGQGCKEDFMICELHEGITYSKT